MELKDLEAYELIESRYVSDLSSQGYRLRHKKTGARVFVLSNSDENKVFYIAFKTPPTDSTGLPHILEHSVLCGSRKFPSKDPFVELAKGSLNTFLNAMTYPDKTVYPVASVNDADFQNLMDVYLDAVFYPNAIKRELIFKQEGWHLELENPEDNLIINGVVYNEMKGVYSSPDDLLDMEILKALYPDCPYGKSSGGDPDVIPTLEYEDFIKFHKKYYHPSNAYIYLYGNMDVAGKLDYIDKQYLKNYETQVIDNAIPLQAPFAEPVFVERKYSITEDEDTDHATYLSLSYCIGQSLDKEQYLALQVINYALLSASGAVLKQALIDAGIGSEVYGNCEVGICQPYFSIVAKGCEPEDKEEFLDITKRVLSDIAVSGFDKKSLLAAINYAEFQYREADFGTHPKGLEFGLQALDSWLYDDDAPYTHIEALETFSDFKKKLEGDYFEEFIKKNFIDNTHRAFVCVKPEKGLSLRLESEAGRKLAAFKDGLTKDQMLEIVAQTKALKEYQKSPSSKEDLEKIPMLKREELAKEAKPFIYELREDGGVKILFHDIDTNGIAYIKLIFNMTGIDADLLPYVGLLPAVLGYVDTANFGFAELFNEINIRSGGLTTSVNVYVDDTDADKFTPCYEFSLKALHSNLESAFEMLPELIFTSKLDDHKRLLEIVGEMRSMMQATFLQSGHSVAALRAMSYFSKSAAYGEIIHGLPLYRLLCDIEDNFEDKKLELSAKLRAICAQIFRKENLLTDYISKADAYEPLPVLIKALYDRLPEGLLNAKPVSISPVRKNEAFYTASKVSFVCCAGNFKKSGLRYTGALIVLKILMSYEYLWNNVRVLGGAYGCMCAFAKSGDSYFVSYRDPNVKKTIDVYHGAVAFIESFDADERNMTKFIIGAISALDTPLTPSLAGLRSLSAFMTGTTYESVQKARDEVLCADPESIRATAKYLEAIFADDCLCVVGSEDKIKNNRDLFISSEALFAS